jgi:hypothetical protein
MATSEILGLFASPEQYQAQQRAQDQAAALQYAGLTPVQQANYGVFSGAQQLGRGLSGVFGVQDPQLRMISQRQQLMQSVDPADPQSLLQAAQRAADMGDQQLALTLADYANKQASEIAQMQQRQAAARREQQQAVPADIAKARELGILITALNELEKTPAGTPGREQQIALLRAQISALQPAEKITPDMSNAAALADLINADRNSEAWKQEYKSQLTRLTTKPENEKKSAFAQTLEDAGYIPGSPMYVSMMDKFLTKELTPKEGRELSFGADREAIAAELYGKPFKDLTQSEKAKVNKRKEDEDNARAASSAAKLVMPGQTKEGPKGISGFRNEVIQSIKPFRDMVTGADSALASIKDSIANQNYISFNAARTQLAKALGDTSLSRRDIEQAGADPSILGGLYDKASTLFTGTPSPDTQKKIESTLRIIRKVAINKAKAELEVQRNLGKRAGYTDDDMAIAFDFPEFKGAGVKPGGGGGNKVDFNSLPK